MKPVVSTTSPYLPRKVMGVSGEGGFATVRRAEHDPGVRFVYTGLHILLEEWEMATTVGIRQFRAGLAGFIDSDEPVAVTRHGQTVGYFIPTRTEQAAEVAALRAAAVALGDLGA